MNPKTCAAGVIGVHAGLIATSSLTLWDIFARTSRSIEPFTPPFGLERFQWLLAIYGLIALVAVLSVFVISVIQVGTGGSWFGTLPYVCPLLAVVAIMAMPALMGLTFMAVYGLALILQPLVCLITCLRLQFRRRTPADTAVIVIGHLYLAGALLGWGAVLLSLVSQRRI